MKWECLSRRDHLYPGAYRGHVLQPCILDGFSGWTCAHCWECFVDPDRADRLHDVVETEGLPTDDREAAALVLAMCASTPTEVTEAGDVLAGAVHAEDVAIATFSFVTVGHFALMGEAIASASDGDWSLWFALGEALLRAGEV